MPKRGDDRQGLAFAGFDSPEANFFRMPNNWTDVTASIANIAELKVVEYILRHTWGYQEFEIKKNITVDEFVRGRKRIDGTRLDRGTGLSERSVRYGLQDALADGLIEEDVDDSDRARVKKYYSLRMKSDPQRSVENSDRQDLPPGVQSLHPRWGGVQTLPPRGANFAPRSEKDNLERHLNNSNIRKSNRSNDDFVDNSASQPISFQENRLVSRNGSDIHYGVEGVSAIIARVGPQIDVAQPVKRPRGRPRKFQDQESQTLLNYVSDFAREFSDKATLNQSATRMINLYHKWGKSDIDAFVGVLYQARSMTKAQNNIRTSKFAYFCSVVEDLLGLKEQQNTASSPGT